MRIDPRHSADRNVRDRVSIPVKLLAPAYGRLTITLREVMMSVARTKFGKRRKEEDTWAADWLTGVASGAFTMSQRKLSSVEAHGGIAAVKGVAVTMGVHLAIVIDDKGQELIAASTHPIRVIC